MTKPLFTADFFANNRRQLRSRVDCELIAVAANGLLQRGADSTFPFAQDANFWYLTGLDAPDLILVLDGSEEYVIVPGRSETREAFDGALSAKDMQAAAGVADVYDEAEGWDKLTKRLGELRRIAVSEPAPAYIEQLGLYVNPARARLNERLLSHQPNAGLADINPELRHLRCRKQPAEIKAIQAAIDITLETLLEAANSQQLKTYKYEYEIEAELSRGFRRRGGAGHAFDPIVASGARACTLHYVANNGRLGTNELVVLDVGAQYGMYAADITRTLVIGKPTKRQQAVYDAVCEVHEYARGLLKPGIMIREYEEKVRHNLGKQLKQLGLIKTVDHEAIRRYYPHATSHFLGLNVHDVGEYDQPLDENMVFTVEPGIYIADEGIGVRIEDDVLITKDGIRVLSEKLPHALELPYN